ncbi:MAG: glycosyltransferase family 1 protein [Pseudomonadota bacterium]
MVVAFFSNQFADKTGHGLARYARELHHALVDIGELDIIPVAGWSSMPVDAVQRLQAGTGLRFTGLGRRGTSALWTLLDTPPLEMLLRTKVDIVHAVSLGYPIATRKPYVVTVHDLGPLTHPHYFLNTRPWVMQRSLDQAVRKADVIVCVSQSTADEVREYVGPSVDDRLQVVLEGVSPDFFETPDPDVLKGLPLPPPGIPFILSAGKISPRKNLQGLLCAMATVTDEIPHHLVLVGGEGWDTPEFQDEVRNPRLADRVHQVGYVSDLQLRALYRAASLYVQPSLYEGFGLPVVEAMASGTPVIVSNRSSLPEVAGSAGRLTDTTNPEAFGATIGEVCNSKETLRQMSEKGVARARTFTWSSAAKAMSKIYGSIAG